MNEFSMAFRDSTNKGIERTKGTPEPTTVVSQLDKCVTKWKNVEYNGRYFSQIQASLEHRREKADEEYESIPGCVEHFRLEWSHTVKAAPCHTGSVSSPVIFI